MGQSFQILFLRKFPCESKERRIKTSVKLRERWARCSDLKGFLMEIFVDRVFTIHYNSPVGLTPRIRSLHSIIDVINNSQSYNIYRKNRKSVCGVVNPKPTVEDRVVLRPCLKRQDQQLTMQDLFWQIFEFLMKMIDD